MSLEKQRRRRVPGSGLSSARTKASMSLKKQREYVASLELPRAPSPRGPVMQDSEGAAGEVFDQAREQAQVVGSGLFSFAKGVTSEIRAAISESALLAQLVANKKVSAETDPLAWFAAYSEVLQNIGWTLQDDAWNDYTTAGTGIEVHEKILVVLSAVLGPAPAALAIVTAAVDALKGMKPDSPWLTLFNHEAQKAKIARFQIGLVETETDSDLFVSLLAFLIQAESTITQVLFFKVSRESASLNARSSKVSINMNSLTGLRGTIGEKTRAFQQDYLSSIVNL
jgi:hypothetical protein